MTLPKIWAVLASNENAGNLAVASLAISIIGLVVTIVGLAAAIYQIVRIKSAVEAGEQATAELRKRLSRNDVIATLKDIENVSSNAIRALDDNNWSRSSNFISDARVKLKLVYTHADSAVSDYTEELQNLLGNLAEHASYLSGVRANGPSLGKISRVKENLHDVRSIVMTISQKCMDGTA